MQRILPPKQPSVRAEFDIEPSRRLIFVIRPDVSATGRLTCLIEPIDWTIRKFALIESLLGKHKHIKRGCWSLRR